MVVYGEIVEEQHIGNLVADDNWMGLMMEISEMVRMAVLEDMKVNTASFIGKDRSTDGLRTSWSNSEASTSTSLVILVWTWK